MRRNENLHNFNFGGYVNSFRDTEEVVVVVGVVTLNSGLNFSTGLDESGDLESVREWQTSGSGESKGERDVVVEFGGVERLSILNLRESIVQTYKQNVKGCIKELTPSGV